MKTKRKNRKITKKKGKKINLTLGQQKKKVLTMLRDFKWPTTERPNVIRESHRPLVITADENALLTFA